MGIDLAREVWEAFEKTLLIPGTPLDGFSARPVMSLGVEASGEGLHHHAETFLALLSGTKAWWVAEATEDVLVPPLLSWLFERLLVHEGFPPAKKTCFVHIISCETIGRERAILV